MNEATSTLTRAEIAAASDRTLCGKCSTRIQRLEAFFVSLKISRPLLTAWPVSRPFASALSRRGSAPVSTPIDGKLAPSGPHVGQQEVVGALAGRSNGEFDSGIAQDKVFTLVGDKGRQFRSRDVRGIVQCLESRVALRQIQALDEIPEFIARNLVAGAEQFLHGHLHVGVQADAGIELLNDVVRIAVEALFGVNGRVRRLLRIAAARLCMAKVMRQPGLGALGPAPSPSRHWC